MSSRFYPIVIIFFIANISPVFSQKFLQPIKKTDWFYHSLEATYLTLTALDLAITYKQLSRGAVEVNPVMRPFIQNKPAAIAVRASVTGAVLFTLRKVKKQDRKAAIIVLGALNLAHLIVVNNNAGILFQINL